LWIRSPEGSYEPKPKERSAIDLEGRDLNDKFDKWLGPKKPLVRVTELAKHEARSTPPVDFAFVSIPLIQLCEAYNGSFVAVSIEGIHLARHESTLCVLRYTHTSNHSQHSRADLKAHRVDSCRSKCVPSFYCVKRAIGCFAQLLWWYLGTSPLDKGCALNAPRIRRAQRHERVAFWDQNINQKKDCAT